ncbi:plant virulence effector HPE1-like domain-containing protein [Rhizobium halophytocola]|uniref:Uncharacterized protein n=1 Tax=Rhizobium halophytocola TaxID=735519 RepID=A0ABS4DXF4_9HYPH|nr:plant virulence effector HPE1-like domain-containing protein [Rhizobium halophytocola]MBP1850381.1 hypothetical protein [Rhizobium halophytocola]
MRGILLTVSLLAIAGQSHAGSIEYLTARDARGDSVMSISCAHCPAPKPAEATANDVPSLAIGTQKITVSDIGGVRKVMRTEAWMGGSPVTFVSTSPVWAADANGTELAIAPYVDTAATTAAVEPAKTGPSTTDTAGAEPLSPSAADDENLRLKPKGA